MTADTLTELHEMADKIGMRRSWFRDKSIPHYDLRRSKRTLAVQNEAIEVSSKELVKRAKGWI